MAFHWSKHEIPHEQADSHAHLFVSSVTVVGTSRVHRVDGFVLAGWALILVKCVLASLAIRHWAIPIADFYVWGPSIMLGALCTGLYLTRSQES